MKLYKIAGYISNGAYRERVMLLEPVEEKTKCFVGCGRRIDKEKIDQVLEGNVINRFETYVYDEEKIDAARRLVYQKCFELAKEKFEKAKADVEGAEKFIFSVPVIQKIDSKGE